MFQPNSPYHYLRDLTAPTTLLYVEDAFSHSINDFLREHFSELTEMFEEANMNLLYLPLLFESEAYQEVLRYNHPYLGPDFGQLEVAEVYAKFFRKYKLGKGLKGLLVIDAEESERKGVFSHLEEGVDLRGQFREIAERVQMVVSEPESMYAGTLSTDLLCFEFEPEGRDLTMDPEVWERIQWLKENATLKVLGRVIDELQKVTNKVSRLFVTNDYRLFLKDYGMREVVMPPLSKCLYLLFLRHPEGIRFKELGDYEDELLSIYNLISLRERPDDIRESIRAMTDPLNNSVNEKCSRIRAAFMEVITEDLAEVYFVTGRRGELKGVKLDRGLVEFQ